jgi:hypothetical protein
METDFSKEIYDNYYNVKERIVEITLKDNRVLVGKLVSFYHGNLDTDPFISQWHFVDKDDLEMYENGLIVSVEGDQNIGMIIGQKDIKEIRFKNYF